MKGTYILQVVMTREQHEKILWMAKQRGKSMSAFAKDVILAQNFPLEKMVIEIHRKIMGDENGN
jgi:hypothetical protein